MMRIYLINLFHLVLSLIILSIPIFIFYSYFCAPKIISPNIQIPWQKEKIIVFESDDWGMCSWFPKREIMGLLLAGKEIFKKEGNSEEWYLDYINSTLERPYDLDRLFTILLKHKGGDRRNVIFQANYIMASPDYEKIKQFNYTVYKDLVIPNVPKGWERGDFVAKAKLGVELGVWRPEYHGNSHLNELMWINLLSSKEKLTCQSFEAEVFQTFNHEISAEYDEKLSIKQQAKNISAGVERFKNLFGYFPFSSIAPSYVWQGETEKILSKKGIKVIQAKNYQQIRRNLATKVTDKVINYLGKKSSDKPWQIKMGDYNMGYDLVYLNRNVDFEPRGKADSESKKGAKGAYTNIVSAWDRNEPAIINTHRINYVSLDEESMSENMKQLDRLLEMIEREHPEAIYLTDWEVAQLYRGGKSVLEYGNSIICRNFSSAEREFEIKIPEDKRVIGIRNLRTSKSVCFRQRGNILFFKVPKGHFIVNLS